MTRNATMIACRPDGLERLLGVRPSPVTMQQTRPGRCAVVVQHGGDALLPATPLVEQILIQAHLGAHLAHQHRRDPRLG
jgi:hypothetical protein